MLTGRYFRFNVDSSLESEGISCFEYHDLPVYFGVFNEMSPRYPISVVITPSEVKFMIHYFIYTDDECKIDSEYSYKIGKNIHAIQHAEETILSFSYSTDSNEAYAKELKGIFEVVFPDTDNHYFSKCIKDRYVPRKTQDDSCRGKILRNLQEQDSRRHNLSYSTCKIWGLVNEERQYELMDKGKYMRFLRKLLLDFMFDLQHSDIFENSVHYERMKTALMSDFFFSAIIKKAEYYYYRELMSYRVGAGSVGSEGDKLCMEYYNSAEKEWCKTIASSLASKHFKHVHSTSFFDKMLEEIRHADEFESKESWFVNPEDEMRRVMFPLKGSEKIGYITTFNWVDYVADNEELKEYIGNVREKSEKKMLFASKWFLRRYNFKDTLRIHFFSKFNTIYLLGLITFICFFLFMLCNEALREVVTRDYWGIPICILVPSAILLSFPVLMLLKHWVKKVRCLLTKEVDDAGCADVKKKLRNKDRKRAFGVFVIIALLAFFFLAKNQGCYVWIKWIALALSQVILYRVYLKGGLHLFLPRLIAAITTAWFTLALSEDLFKAFFDQHLSTVTICLLILVVFIFLYSEISKIIPFSTSFQKFMRVMQLMLIGYAVSLFVGFVMVNFTGETFLERSGYLEQYFKEHDADEEFLAQTHSELLDSLVSLLFG